MSLGGTVMCNCLKEGWTTPFPYLDEIIFEDKYPTIGCANPDRPTDEEWRKIRMFDEWQEHCCEHPGMDYVSVGVANVAGYYNFIASLAHLGWQHFPILHEVFPERMMPDGTVSPDMSAKALAELDYFEHHIESVIRKVLVDSDSGMEINNGVDWIGLVSRYSGQDKPIHVAVDKAGFFIEENDQVQFRATRLEERLLPDNQTEYVNLDNGQRAISILHVGEEGTRKMHVTEKMSKHSDYEYILKSLRTLFEASVQLGNPVRWN